MSLLASVVCWYLVMRIAAYLIRNYEDHPSRCGFAVATNLDVIRGGLYTTISYNISNTEYIYYIVILIY